MIHIDPKELICLREGGLTNEEIAARFKCSVPTIANRTRELHLDGKVQFKRKRGREVKHISKEMLYEASKEMTVKQLAKQFNVSASTISKRLVEYGIPTRSKSLIDRIANDVRALSVSKTRKEIASILEVGISAVDRCCGKHKIRCKGAHQTMTTAKRARRDAILALIGQANWTNSEVALAMDISRERVRQIVAYSNYTKLYANNTNTSENK